MYNFKEKSRYLQDMTNPQYAEADLQLLRQLSPGHALLRTPILRPAKAAHKILYALLDVTTVETIRLHRRRSETDKIPPSDPGNLTVIAELLADKCSITKNNNNAHHPDSSDGTTPSSPASAQSASPDTDSSTPATTSTDQREKEVSTPAPEQQNQEQTTADLQEALEQALSEKESLEEEKEEIISEKEEIEETLEQTQAALDAVQEELETEKKSPEPPSDKKKKSTPTSDGETSSTETSK